VSIFKKSRHGKRNDDKAEPAESELPDSHQIAKDFHLPNKASDDNKLESNRLPEFDIDLRLDHDLSDHHETSRHARARENEFDFDLSLPGNEELSSIETQVLQVNPLKSFSQQLDINFRKFGEAGYIRPDDADTELANCFRKLKRPVLNNVLGRGATVLDNANLIMITSSLPGEGKSFTAINMAMSIAMERDQRVLLIDADISKPSHHEIFGVQSTTGLTDILTGRVEDVSKAIYKTNFPTLSLMFAGSRTPNTTELFASKAMANFTRELSDRYEDRVIIFDSAPLLLATEASVLASHMGQVILVIEAERTRRETVRHSLDVLNNRIVLLLLNKMRGKSDMGSYGTYGAYGTYGTQE
jgi:protein-tyrosine kinase